MALCTLALEFDVNQGTQSLQYKFSNAEQTEGVLAGTFNFNNSPEEEDSLQVTLTVTGSIAGSPSVMINDCTLVSVSNGELGRTFLSPFSQKNAVTQIMNWSEFEEQKAVPSRFKLFSVSKDILPVVARRGQWQISGYLSTSIEIDGIIYNRIFTFDPEGTSGGGQGFP